jgi:hypothetical protein
MQPKSLQLFYKGLQCSRRLLWRTNSAFLPKSLAVRVDSYPLVKRCADGFLGGNKSLPEGFSMESLEDDSRTVGAAKEGGEVGAEGGIEAFNEGGVDDAECSLGKGDELLDSSSKPPGK